MTGGTKALAVSDEGKETVESEVEGATYPEQDSLREGCGE
jgi:hypothetical protein